MLAEAGDIIGTSVLQLDLKRKASQAANEEVARAMVRVVARQG